MESSASCKCKELSASCKCKESSASCKCMESSASCKCMESQVQVASAWSQVQVASARSQVQLTCEEVKSLLRAAEKCLAMTPCNDSHEKNSSEPSGRTLRHAFGNKHASKTNTSKTFQISILACGHSCSTTAATRSAFDTLLPATRWRTSSCRASARSWGWALAATSAAATLCHAGPRQPEA